VASGPRVAERSPRHTAGLAPVSWTVESLGSGYLV
jgi:hypothetical protein